MSTVNSARAQFYTLLSSLFSTEVDSAMLAELRDEKGQAFLHYIASEAQFKQYVDIINEKLKSLLNERDILELSADYCGLFLVDTNQSASPYAGQYLEKNKTDLFGKHHQKMLRFLTEGKLQLSTKFPEPADHISVILAYLSYLCTHAQPLEQIDFIRNYLLIWVDKFSQKVNEKDQGKFYGALASLSCVWIQFDLDFLTDES